MNIIVKPHDSELCYCRPDTTWERENKDYYVPEGVENLSWTPIVFARISKAGKCISPKFASRYHDAFNFGILLHIGDGERAFTSCADHTSLLPSPLYNTIVIENEENEFSVALDDNEIFRAKAGCELKNKIEEAICIASRLTSLRIGDYVSIELAPVSILNTDRRQETELKAIFCENIIIEKKIIL